MRAISPATPAAAVGVREQHDVVPAQCHRQRQIAKAILEKRMELRAAQLAVRLKPCLDPPPSHLGVLGPSPESGGSYIAAAPAATHRCKTAASGSPGTGSAANRFIRRSNSILWSVAGAPTDWSAVSLCDNRVEGGEGPRGEAEPGGTVRR